MWWLESVTKQARNNEEVTCKNYWQKQIMFQSEQKMSCILPKVWALSILLNTSEIFFLMIFKHIQDSILSANK